MPNSSLLFFSKEENMCRGTSLAGAVVCERKVASKLKPPLLKYSVGFVISEVLP